MERVLTARWFTVYDDLWIHKIACEALVNGMETSLVKGEKKMIYFFHSFRDQERRTSLNQRYSQGDPTYEQMIVFWDPMVIDFEAMTQTNQRTKDVKQLIRVPPWPAATNVSEAVPMASDTQPSPVQTEQKKHDTSVLGGTSSQPGMHMAAMALHNDTMENHAAQMEKHNQAGEGNLVVDQAEDQPSNEASKQDCSEPLPHLCDHEDDSFVFIPDMIQTSPPSSTSSATTLEQNGFISDCWLDPTANVTFL